MIDPDEAARARRVLDRPSGVPTGQMDASQVRPAEVERYNPVDGPLDPELGWVFAGLAYTLVGLDRSLFALYSADIGQPVVPLSVLTRHPVATFSAVDVSRNRWFHTLQGIDPSRIGDFVDFVESFEFKQGTSRWRIRASTVTIPDPNATVLGRDLQVTFLLPTTTTGQNGTTRRVALSTVPIPQFRVEAV